MLRCTVLLAIAAGALVVPNVAAAGTLTVDRPCVEQSQPFHVSGNGFTPDLNLALSDGGSTYPDETGAFSDYQIIEQPYDGFTPKTVTLTATDQGDPARNASVNYQVVKFGSNLPVNGRPGSTVKWSFALFPAGSTIYGHFRYRNKIVRDYRFGTASGPCGLLSVKAKRIPVKKPKHTGGWYVQIDTKPKFSFNTRPEYDLSFSID